MSTVISAVRSSLSIPYRELIAQLLSTLSSRLAPGFLAHNSATRIHTHSVDLKTRRTMMSKTFELFERRPYLVIIAIGLVFSLAYLIAMTVFPRAHGRVIDGDGIQYYAYVRSMVFDADLDFFNDYELLYGSNGGGGVWTTTRTSTGYVINLMSIGPALLWLPAFLMAYIATWSVNLFGAQIPIDGISLPFQLSVGLAGIAYATTGVCLCFRLAKYLFGAESAFWAVLVTWLASPAIYYSLSAPAYSHATSLFAVALFVDTWYRTREQTELTRYLVLGALAGLVTLVRWQDAIIVLLPLAESAHGLLNKKTSLAVAFQRLGVMAGITALMFTPQILAWHAIYGELLLTPQGSDFMRWTDPQVLSVLFSWNHGLFSWTPGLLIAVCGLYWLRKRDAMLACGSVLVIFTAIYVNASVEDWWAGEAFGARRFISYSVLFAIGLAALMSSYEWFRLKTWVRCTALCLIVSNVLFLAQYQLSMRGYANLASYPTTAQQVLLERFFIPWRLLTEPPSN